MNYYNGNQENLRVKSNYLPPLEALSKGSINCDVYLDYLDYVPKKLDNTYDNEIKAVRFAILDLNLYLDLNPNDEQIKALIDKYLNYYEKLLLNKPLGVMM